MAPKRVDEIEDHLSTCENCRCSLESTVGDRAWWQDLESALRSDTADGEYENTESKESVCQRLTALLGPTDDPSMLGRIGTYEIIGLLGYGGMGAVFKGFDRSLNRFVAIKMLLPHLAASGAARKRFVREAQAVAAVVDDHVMAIHCVDEWQGVPYLVMTYSRGVSLQERLNESGPLETRKILRIGMQASKGLAAAHAQGIVHRDMKPANVFLDQNVERVQLMDFGLARAVDDASLTRSGTLAGTPQYMSPEQARAETVDHRSDLFSLGSVMYAMCTGHAPFRAESSYAVLRLITDKEPSPIREINPDVPEWLCSIIRKLMEKNASDRFGSALQIADILEACLAHIQAQVLPFLEQESIFEAALQEMRNGVTILRNSKRRTTIPVLQCPSNPDLGLLVNPDLGALFAFTDYCGVAGSDRDNGVFALDLRKPRTFFAEVTGGLSNTLLFGERPPSDLDEGFGPWLGGQGAWSASTYTNGTRGLFPTSGASQVNLLAACDGRTNLGFQRGERGTRCPTHHWSFHPGGAVFAKADGSVTFLSYATERTVLADLASRD